MGAPVTTYGEEFESTFNVTLIYKGRPKSLECGCVLTFVDYVKHVGPYAYRFKKTIRDRCKMHDERVEFLKRRFEYLERQPDADGAVGRELDAISADVNGLSSDWKICG
jgi:hypothetical protein